MKLQVGDVISIEQVTLECYRGLVGLGEDDGRDIPRQIYLVEVLSYAEVEPALWAGESPNDSVIVLQVCAVRTRDLCAVMLMTESDCYLEPEIMPPFDFGDIVKWVRNGRELELATIE